jgi:hypothetical protein
MLHLGESGMVVDAFVVGRLNGEPGHARISL